MYVYDILVLCPSPESACESESAESPMPSKYQNLHFFIVLPFLPKILTSKSQCELCSSCAA